MSEEGASPQEPEKIPRGKGGVPLPVHRQFGKPGGNPGNPGGRRKGASILAVVERLLAADPDPRTGEGRLAQEVAKRIVDGPSSNDDASIAAHALALMRYIDGAKIQAGARRKRIKLTVHVAEAARYLHADRLLELKQGRNGVHSAPAPGNGHPASGMDAAGG